MDTSPSTMSAAAPGAVPRQGRAAFDAERLYKIPSHHRYLNISTLWIPYYRHVVRLLYVLRVRHEAVTLLSLASGLIAAALIAVGRTYAALVAAAALVHFKDLFDAADGSLARLTGTGHRTGRFLDTIGDGVVFTSLILALAYRQFSAGHAVSAMAWAVPAWLSLFLQCSYFNYYSLQYMRYVGIQSGSRLDERFESGEYGSEGRDNVTSMTRVLARLYDAWFGWQDRLVARWDRRSKIWAGVGQSISSDSWYSDRRVLTANSALCYGTHAFVLIACLVAGKPGWFFHFVTLGMNLYLAGIVVMRIVSYRRRYAG